MIKVIIGGTKGPYEKWLVECLTRQLRLSGNDFILYWGATPDASDAPSLIIPRSETFLSQAKDIKEHLLTNRPIFSRRNDNVCADLDILSWIGWLIARTEEYTGFTPDPHGRFPRNSSLMQQLGLMEKPVADLLIKELLAGMTLLRPETPSQRLLPWPNGKKFAVCLTHDVDRAFYRHLRTTVTKTIGGAVSLMKGDAAQARRRWSEGMGLLLGGDACPYWLFDPMARMEQQRQVRSAFYLLPHHTDWVNEGPERVLRYDVRHANIQRFFRRVADEGWEIGLHAGYNSYDLPDGLDTDWRSLQQDFGPQFQMHGLRGHYLRFSVPRTWRKCEALGIEYDVTLGWPEGWGFRSGTAWPYQPFCPESARPLNVWELGTHMMDVAVKTPQEALNACRKLLEETAAVNGCACILMHPTVSYEITMSETLRLYEDMLNMICSRTDAWIATPIEVVQQMRLILQSKQ